MEIKVKSSTHNTYHDSQNHSYLASIWRIDNQFFELYIRLKADDLMLKKKWNMHPSEVRSHIWVSLDDQK
jgi:hypothetical protein